jgi:hypothetical protein
MEALINRFSQLWCEIAHNAPMWPMHGRYECRTCGRQHKVEWAGQAVQQKSGAVFTWKLARASK